MNRRAGWALIKHTWTSWMQQRGFFFLLAFMWMVPPLVYLFVWVTAAGEGSIGGMDRDQFIAYYLVLIVVNQLTYDQTNWTVGDVIRMGSMNGLLLRPMSPVWDALASEVAGKVVYMTLIVPITALLGLVLRPEMNLVPLNVVAFFLSLALAWMLRFFWGYWLALLAFWATRADSLLALQDALVFLLAGQVAPMSVLPALMQTLARALPFRYMIGFPVELLTNQLAGSEIALGFALQVGWLAVSLGLFRLLWHRGLRHYSAVGG